ncbi:gliding motility-associated C-terminal domain-containing protein [Hymenobacter negativus]|uniref:Gliding motility-associated C-terminal domain-containing protein n=1 Tax=Hymenobacter negativus TaxID=2795026 RepID=A0ABS3QLZ2_9BACT|nr:gliding motility-associated C-terminal domain-containing protein [Hymenobacter negativus]MBO2011695.1 gliding motility-associated C-terminal domain-containing protein [Hymenobacter negativus]
MEQRFTLGARLLVRPVLLTIMLLAGLALRPDIAYAMHIRAGDIQAKVDTTSRANPFRIFFKLTLYTDPGPNVPEEFETVFFGDGTSSCYNGIPRAVVRGVPGTADTDVNIYYFEHTYQSVGAFEVEFIGQNRVAGVLNMANSSTQTFYLRTRITIDPTLGRNHSAILTAPAVDKAGLYQVFQHNPAGFDADGDSLAYKLVPCQQVPAGVLGTLGPPCTGTNGGTGTNNPIPINCTNYRLPNTPNVTAANNPPYQVDFIDQYGVQTGFAGQPATFVQDVQTGMITWNAPVAVGFYNVAMVVEEWRRFGGGRKRLIGEVVRDMQINVLATNDLPPSLIVPADICVVAGQRVSGTVTATDGVSPTSSAATAVSLFAYSGIIPPATFVQSQTGPLQASGTFAWQTDCSNVARLPYQVTFKAQDTPTGSSSTNPPLVDIKVWRITVVGPPPQSLQATAVPGSNPTSITLNWNTYQCANASQMNIYRRINQSGWVPSACETGIPASAGYVRIGTVPIGTTTFTDAGVDASGTVRGLDRGLTYCYRIYADFPLPAGGRSIASAEACASIPGASARLIKVDVTSTQTNTGQIEVCWTEPRSATGAPFDGTPSYVLSRAEGLNPAATAFVPVTNITTLSNTCYTDTNLNTLDKQYTYKLDFVQTFPPGAGATITETAAPASSVRLSALPDPRATFINLNWTHNVPWDNTAHPTTVYRRMGGTSAYTRIGTATSTATGGTYTDNDPTLVKGQSYCYYVQTDGQYANIPALSSLLNRSQERCLDLITPPCTPELTLVTTNCDSLSNLPEFPGLRERYTNRLRWTVGRAPAGCEAAIASYRVYYRPTPTGAFAYLGSTAQPGFVHPNLLFSGGCYAVQAVASSGALSDTSNVACQDNCLFFKLPNVFTPNGDGQNDVFRPKNNSPVRRIRFQAFNRWGVQVFQNTTTADDPVLINWNAGGLTGDFGKAARVSGGVYYYLAEVEFADFANTKRTYKGWVEVIR